MYDSASCKSPCPLFAGGAHWRLSPAVEPHWGLRGGREGQGRCSCALHRRQGAPYDSLGGGRTPGYSAAGHLAHSKHAELPGEMCRCCGDWDHTPPSAASSPTSCWWMACSRAMPWWTPLQVRVWHSVHLRLRQAALLREHASVTSNDQAACACSASAMSRARLRHSAAEVVRSDGGRRGRARHQQPPVPVGACLHVPTHGRLI